MKNRANPIPDGSLPSAAAGYQQLLSSLGDLRNQTVEALFEVERLAMLVEGTQRQHLLNDLATSLEVIDAQLEYYFPEGSGQLDLDEWSHILASLNSAAEWAEDQLIEVESYLGSARIAGRLRELSRSCNAAVSELIAARFGADGHYAAPPAGRQRNQRQSPTTAARAHRGLLAISH